MRRAGLFFFSFVVACHQAPAPASPAPRGLVATDAGVGPLHERSVVSKRALEAAFPGHDVSWVPLDEEEDGTEQGYFAIKRGKALILKVFPAGEGLDMVEIVHPSVTSSLGVRLDLSYADVVSQIGPLDCGKAVEEGGGRRFGIACHTGRSERLQLLFEGEGNPKAVASGSATLGQAKLVALRWAIFIEIPESPE